MSDLSQNKMLEILDSFFPNGFASWKDTHFEVVSFIAIQQERCVKDCMIYDVQNAQGTGGIYKLADEWTSEFENENKGREWDGEFFDELEAFLNRKNSEQ